jgi:hypothetical protein
LGSGRQATSLDAPFDVAYGVAAWACWLVPLSLVLMVRLHRPDSSIHKSAAAGARGSGRRRFWCAMPAMRQSR